jgi:hypothetical protein
MLWILETTEDAVKPVAMIIRNIGSIHPLVFAASALLVISVTLAPSTKSPALH